MSRTDSVSIVRRVEKPWAHEEIVALASGRLDGKATHLRRRQSMSLQYYARKAPTISGQSGARHGVTTVMESGMLETSATWLDDVLRLQARYDREGASAP